MVDTRKRVLQVIGNVGLGGGEHYVLRLATHMTRYGFDTICTCRPGGEFETLLGTQGIEGFPVRLSKERNIFAARHIARFCRDRDIGIVHAHGAVGAQAARLASILYGGPRPITTYHVAITNITDIPPWKKKLFALLDRMMSGVDRRVLAVSEAVRGALIREAFFSPDRLHVLYTGIDADSFNDCRMHEFRKEIDVDPDSMLIGAVGRLSEEKGMDILIDAMPRILREFPSLTLVIAGDGPLKEALYRKTCNRGVDARVRFLGYRRDIERLLTGLDLLVMPSWTEGFPLVLLEAMAAGVPVVATKVGGIPEIVTDGREGVLVPPGDSLRLADRVITLMRDSSLREKMAGEGRKRVLQRFSLGRMLQELNDIYRGYA